MQALLALLEHGQIHATSSSGLSTEAQDRIRRSGQLARHPVPAPFAEVEIYKDKTDWVHNPYGITEMMAIPTEARLAKEEIDWYGCLDSEISSMLFG